MNGRLLAVFAALLLALWGAPGPSGTPAALAQTPSPIQVEVNQAQVDFGAEIRFQFRARGAEPIRSVLFLYEVDDSDVQNTAVPAYQAGPQVTAVYSWRVAGVLLPGAEVRYQWLLETASGRTITTTEQAITYQDTRFTWREARDDQVTVFYHSPDPQAGAALLEEVRKTQSKLSRDYGLTLDKPLRIFAYTRREDYATAVYTGRPIDIAITAGTDRIFVLAPAGTSGMTDALEGLRREVANAIFLQKTRNPYGDPPRWLSQGFSLFVGGEDLSEDTYKALGQYAQDNRLLPLKTLNGNFPTTRTEQALAYAESISVVKFMMDTYGPEKMKALLAAFKEGNTVDDALKKGLGVTLDQLETRWKNALKSGAAARPNSGQRAPRGSPESESGSGGLADRLLGPAVSFWGGVFGKYTTPVLLGFMGVMGLGVVALVAGTAVSLYRRNRSEE